MAGEKVEAAALDNAAKPAIRLGGRMLPKSQEEIRVEDKTKPRSLVC